MPGGARTRGRWNSEEHRNFLVGLSQLGKDWAGMRAFVPTRSTLQIRTHAQKYFKKMNQGLPFPSEPYAGDDDNDGDDDDNDNDDDAEQAANAHASFSGGAAGAAAAATVSTGSTAASAPFFDGYASIHGNSNSIHYASDGCGGGGGGGSSGGGWNDGFSFDYPGWGAGGGVGVPAPPPHASPLLNPSLDPSAAFHGNQMDGMWPLNPSLDPSAAFHGNQMDGMWPLNPSLDPSAAFHGNQMDGMSPLGDPHGVRFPGQQQLRQQQQQQQHLMLPFAEGSGVSGDGVMGPILRTFDDGTPSENW